MKLRSFSQMTGRLALVTATSGFAIGLALLNGGTAHSIGGLCNGTPASHTWLDASGQYGPALLDGTNHDDTIIGSDGDDTIDAGPGNDVVCGAAGDDSISGGTGDDAIRGDTGDDDLDGGPGRDTVVGDGGNDTVAGGTGNDFLVGGTGDDVMISSDDDSVDKVNAGDDFDVCLFGAGDEHTNSQYRAVRTTAKGPPRAGAAPSSLNGR
jgi:Ca2+-binding RTX toxin-like protein